MFGLQAYWAHGTKLQLKSHGDYVEYNLNYPYRDAPVQKEDLGVDNPVYAGDLTKKQQQNCVSLHYGCLDQISEDFDCRPTFFQWNVLIENPDLSQLLEACLSTLGAALVKGSKTAMGDSSRKTKDQWITSIWFWAPPPIPSDGVVCDPSSSPSRGLTTAVPSFYGPVPAPRLPLSPRQPSPG